MKKSLDNQLHEARKHTKMIIEEYYKESKFEIIIILTLFIFVIVTILSLLFTF